MTYVAGDPARAIGGVHGDGGGGSEACAAPEFAAILGEADDPTAVSVSDPAGSISGVNGYGVGRVETGAYPEDGAGLRQVEQFGGPMVGHPTRTIRRMDCKVHGPVEV
jgi:hypothetical protein